MPSVFVLPFPGSAPEYTYENDVQPTVASHMAKQAAMLPVLDEPTLAEPPPS